MTAPITISVTEASMAAALTPDGSLGLVANLRSGTVTVVDVATQHAEGPPIRVGSGPCSIAITPDGLTALVSNGNDATVSVIDVPSRTERQPAIPLPGADVLAISPDGTLAFVGSITDGATPNGLYAIDMATLTVLSPMIQIPTTISGIAFSADGTLAYVTDSDNGSVIVIDVLAREVKPARIHVGAYPMGIAISSDGLTALVGNAGDDTVSMIDLPTHHVSSPIPVGQGPQAVAITPDGAYGLAANLVSNDLTIINLAQQTTQTIGTGKDPIAVVVSQTGPSAANGEPGGPAVLVVNQVDQTVMLI
jgi:YVTN family beta-propeller protein